MKLEKFKVDEIYCGDALELEFSLDITKKISEIGKEILPVEKLSIKIIIIRIIKIIK